MKRGRTISTRTAGREISGLPEGFNPVIRRILSGRGITDASELSLGLADMQHPDSLAGLQEAVSLVADAVTGKQRILVVGDFDADGATGTALALLSLRSMGAAKVDFRVPNRFEFGYGLTVPLVETLANNPPDLLLTVDSGINCVAGVARARELGSRVIVTDHHLPGKELPAAHAIVNPNQAGDDFPSKALAGVGVMFYLLIAVRTELRERGWFGPSRREPNLARYLDLVALGTVADLVPLDHNNRVLVRQGLERIRRGQARPGLMALLRCGKRDYRYVTASDLGFAAGPRLNAAGRLEDMGAGINCLLCEDADEARSIASELDTLNQQRRSMQDRMQAEAMKQVSGLLDSLESSDLPEALCLFDEEWHQGVVGLVASRIKDAVHRPVIAFAPESDGSDLLKGSARSVRGLHIRDVLALVDSRSPGLIRAFGGHAMAAGLTLERGSLDSFRTALADAVITQLDGAELNQEILTDGELEGGELCLDTALAIEQYGPWGQRFPEPLFDGRFEVINSFVVGGAHLKMVVRSPGGGMEIDAIAFGRLPEDLPGNGPVRLLYRLGVNRWRGKESAQLLVEHIVR
jgi:single-stranded-DNA-specific exonuclease